jgi:hypothetical protein
MIQDRPTVTLRLCRTNLTDFIDLFYYATATPNAGAGMTWISPDDKWADRGISGSAFPVQYGPKGSVFIPENTADKNKMVAGYPYSFRYVSSKNNCFAGDSGLFVVVLDDPFVSKDYRVQMCNIGMNGYFDLADFTGIKDASWSFAGKLGQGDIMDNKLSRNQLAQLDGGTHKLQYTVAADCGSGTGVMYIKIAGNAHIPAEVTEKFCKATLPEVINVNEVLGYYGFTSNGENVWELSEIKKGGDDVDKNTTVGYFTPATGVFKLVEAISRVPELGGLDGITESTTLALTFELNNANCITGSKSKLTIEIVNSIVTE